MAPVVAVNCPDFKAGRDSQIGNKPGTVGHPVPGVAVKIVDPVTAQQLPANAEGLLLVKGPNRMLGYLGQPERTEEALRDGWYVTGDIAALDDEGFLRITDRLSRFSKIGGEMVPHVKIEQQIQALIDGAHTSVVTSIADPTRGERLVAFYTDTGLTPQQLWERLCLTELPRLWLPKREDLRPIDAIPILGTGKVDLRAVRQLASKEEGVQHG